MRKYILDSDDLMTLKQFMEMVRIHRRVILKFVEQGVVGYTFNEDVVDVELENELN